MKLRLRSTESRETLKIEAPNSSSLQHLKQILSQTLPNSPSPSSIRLSLNRKDHLQSETAQSLHSLGIASGDLIFYSLDDHHSPSIPLPAPNSDMVVESSNSASSMQNPPPTDPNSDLPDSESSKTEDSSNDAHKRKTLGLEEEEEAGDVDMEVDGEDEADDLLAALVDDKSLSVPGFLRKVFVEELGNYGGTDHKLMVTAVHAIFLESGFVGFDSDSNMVIRGLGYHGDWRRMVSLSLNYTLPEIGITDSVHTVVLRFQSLGKFMNVYGKLSGGGVGKSSTRSVVLNEGELVPLLNVVWANCGVQDTVRVEDGVTVSVEKVVFEFWRSVKDNLALPLLIDICDKAGFNLPPCFMRLPTDLKLKIMELSAGVEIAKLSCACSELRYLASNDELWKLKCAEEFGKKVKDGQGSWKMEFIRETRRRHTSRYARNRSEFPYLYERRGFRYGRQPFAPHFPGIIGGDYDLFPNLGISRYPRLGDNINRFRLNFSPECHLEDLADEI